MGLLFLQLMNYTDLMETNTGNGRQKLVIDVLRYVEEHYRDGELSQLAGLLHCDMYWLSKEIKKLTGCNYTELVQKKRLNQAGYLLRNTSLSVMDIAMSVGYENMSYFHRIFQAQYGMTPRHYRINQ
jgi:YesN/AraC family two-component response regulator